MTKSDLACHIRAAAAVIDPADPCLSQDSKIECRIFYKDLGKLLGGTGGSGADSGTEPPWSTSCSPGTLEASSLAPITAPIFSLRR